MTRRRLLAPLVALLLSILAFVAGCSGIPSSGPVTDVRQVGEVTEPAQPQAPEAGQLPDQIVRGFIEASADASNAPYASAQQFLTPQAQAEWQPTQSPVTILDEPVRLDPDPEDPSTVTVRGTQVAVLDTDRSYRAMVPQAYERTFTLEPIDGEWRIADPPQEVILQQKDFSQAFRQRSVYFLDQAGTVVVPDLRYLEAALSPANRLTRLTNLLLGGPSTRLQGAVVTRLGKTAALLSNVTTDEQGVVHVDLTRVDASTTSAASGLAAQIVWTLYPDAKQVAISVDGVPLATGDPSGGVPVYTMQSVESFDPDRIPSSASAPTTPWFIDPNGALVSLTDDMEPMWGKVGTGSYRVASAAMSAANGTLAAVTEGTAEDPEARSLLLGRPLEHQPTTAVLVADSLTPPTFTRSGDKVWTVQNGVGQQVDGALVAAKPQIIEISTAANPTRQPVQGDELNGKGDVTQLVLSPDGVRVAVVAGNRLYVGVVVPANPDALNAATGPAWAVDRLVEVAPQLSNVGPVAFASASLMIVGASTGSGLRVLYQVGIDGQQLLRTTDNGFFGDVTSVATAVGQTGQQPVLMSWGNRIYQLEGGWQTGRWIAPLDQPVVQGTGPFYPN